MPAPCHLVVEIYRGVFSEFFLLEMAGSRHEELRWAKKKDLYFLGFDTLLPTISFIGASYISYGWRGSSMI